MTSALQFAAYGIAVLVILISLLNPGGKILAGLAAAFIVVVGWLGPFIRDFVLNATKGRWDGRQRTGRDGGENP
ncbi:hypothetical protein [Halostella litorea]|uniref:hypothetical protein n=1 Tax=Halostella litorea TaxID=2528831 RepID=UPI00109218C7|nr:hypothetical protein [Halostella litorea]